MGLVKRLPVDLDSETVIRNRDVSQRINQGVTRFSDSVVPISGMSQNSLYDDSITWWQTWLTLLF